MQAPKIPSFFKTKKPNQFYYEPRYYNERKEKMQERYSRISRELNTNKGDRTDAEVFRSNLRHSWESSRNGGAGHKLNYRIVLYIFALTALAYYFLK